MRDARGDGYTEALRKAWKVIPWTIHPEPRQECRGSGVSGLLIALPPRVPQPRARRRNSNPSPGKSRVVPDHSGTVTMWFTTPALE